MCPAGGDVGLFGGVTAEEVDAVQFTKTVRRGPAAEENLRQRRAGTRSPGEFFKESGKQGILFRVRESCQLREEPSSDGRPGVRLKAD